MGVDAARARVIHERDDWSAMGVLGTVCMDSSRSDRILCTPDSAVIAVIRSTVHQSARRVLRRKKRKRRKRVHGRKVERPQYTSRGREECLRGRVKLTNNTLLEIGIMLHDVAGDSQPQPLAQRLVLGEGRSLLGEVHTDLCMRNAQKQGACQHLYVRVRVTTSAIVGVSAWCDCAHICGGRLT